MPNYETILYSISDGISRITLNRPKVLNAFDEKMLVELHEALKWAEQDPEVRCIVLTGSGRGFCSGQDLKGEGEAERRSLRESLLKRYNPIIRRMRKMDKPILGMINGVAAGAGCSLALACDMRIASDQASFIEVFIRIGLVPDSGSHWFLTRLVGLGKAFELATLGDKIEATEAERIGLVNKVVPHGDLERITSEYARRLSTAPTKAIGLIKRGLNKAAASDLETVLEYESYLQEIASGTEDHEEGLRAFLEKRPPNFKGH
jgi:2-(1,2-epoxy-1,2-dihydrophenyl)acetyl-CoA isomerase